MDAINLDEKFSCISEHWAPRIIAGVNDFHVKLAKIEGEFTWHAHGDTDEMFLVNKGSLTIRLRDRDVRLGAGDMFVVPRGVEHKPVADGECEILMIERAGTVNTGDGDSADDHKATEGEWL